MSSSSSTSKKLILKTSDEEIFEVDEAVAMESKTIKHLIEDNCADNAIPLPNVTSKILSKVIEYCNKHVINNPNGVDDDKDSLKDWDADFMKVNLNNLLELILAANYLDIKSLLDLTIQEAANMIKDKTVEEVRKIFNIPNDYTPEEEEEVRKENEWAFE